MKTKIILPVIVVLFAAVIIANGFYGNKIAKEIDANLKARIAENELPVGISYSEVKVNPAFSKVKITNVTVSAPDEEGSFKCESLDIDIPYKEALRWTESEEFEEIKSFKLTLVKPQINGDKGLPFLEFDDLVVDFDGQLSKADFEELAVRFPDKKQNIELSFSALQAKLPENRYNEALFLKLQEQISSLDAGRFILVYNPESKEINIPEFSIESPVISYKGQASFKYKGDGVEDFTPESVAMETDMRVEPDNFEWEDKNGGSGEFELDKLVFNTKSTVSFDNKTFPQGDMQIEIENLNVHYDDGNMNKGKSMMNFSFNNLDVKNFKFNYHLDKEKLSINDSRLVSSLIEAEVTADIDVDSSNPANSNINIAKLRIQKLAPDLEKLVQGFEQQMGRELPRENDAIVLELTGRLSKPTIKGFEF